MSNPQSDNRKSETGNRKPETENRSSMDRRKFLSMCACCAGGASCALLTSCATLGGKAPTERPKIRLVFCETPNDKPIWPNIGYDFEARRKQMLATLTNGCPEIEFLPAVLMNKPEESKKLIEAGAEVDGYMICIQGLGWANDIVKLSTTGKPTLVVDNLYGGSGKFLTELYKIVGSGKPVDWVSSSRDEDIVKSARNFALLKQPGKTAEDFVAACRAARHKATRSAFSSTCKDDPLPPLNLDEALARVRGTKILVVGATLNTAFAKATEEMFGVTLVAVPFPQIAEAYEQAAQGPAEEFAARWMQGAQKIDGPTRETIEGCGRMYGAMKRLMDQQGARGITINCLGGFYQGHLKSFPCLGFCQLNNDGLIGACEADTRSSLTMLVGGAMSGGRPGYISDPVIDTSKNQIIYAHCVAMTKAFGPKGASNPYRILTHSEDRKGASMQSLLPSGYMTTTMWIDPPTKQVLFHQAKAVENIDNDMACRTKLAGQVIGDIEKLTANYKMGWHRVTFYGDLKPHAQALCKKLGLTLVEEA
ncbi:MAG: hypothetical protein NTX50_09110 [Candidatus Sumerlaeota bacterium]|nr:hypothetical protein [Candidatus Sumerlaeota bacterium]